MSDLLNTINIRSTIRKYTDQPLTDDEITTLVEAGLRAPTARNSQEIHFSIVKRGNPVLDELQKELNPDAPMKWYYDAPVVFFLSGSDYKWAPVDAGIAVENIHLAATAMGLGSVILGCVDGVLKGEHKAYFDEKLAIPEGYSYIIALAVGHKDTEKQQHTFDFEKNVSVL